jgi:hypothetical protein
MQASGLIAKNDDGRYALTEFGEGLRTPVIGLAIWGMGMLAGHPELMEKSRPDMVALCMTAAVDPAMLTGLDFECDVDTGDLFTVSVHESELSVSSGTHSGPRVHRLRCSATVFLALTAGLLQLGDAVNSESAHVEGSLDDLRAMFGAFAAACRVHVPS